MSFSPKEKIGLRSALEGRRERASGWTRKANWSPKQHTEDLVSRNGTEDRALGAKVREAWSVSRPARASL